MAQVYDREELKDAEEKPAGSGGLSTSTGGGKIKYTSGAPKSAEPGELSTSTAPGKTDYTSEIPTEEHSLYNSSATSQGRIRFGNLLRTRRRRVILGSSTIGGTIITLLILTVTSGPLQLIHLSQILQKNFAGNEQTANIRTKGLFRYARTGDIGETRVGRIGSGVFGKTSEQLKSAGIEFERNGATGAPRSMSIDTTKDPAYKGLTKANRIATAIEQYNITDASIVSEPKPGVIKINLDATSLKGIDFTNAYLKTALSKLNKGKLASAMDLRVMKRFFNLPRLFSPLEKRIKAGENNLAEKAATKKAEADRQKAIIEEQTPEIKTATDNVKNALKDNQGKLTAVLLGAQMLCIVRSIAGDAVTVNRALIVLPPTVKSVDKIALGSQVQTNNNFTLEEIGAVSDGFRDSNGKTIWDAKALQATAGATNPGGVDLPYDYAQAFSNTTTADNIRKAIEVKLAGVDITGAVCSKVGLIVQVVAGVALLIAGIPTAGGSWGAYIAGQAAIAAGTAGVIYMLQQQLTPLLEDKVIVPDILSGPLGGNLMAYGAREASNIGSRANGGVELNNTEKTTLSLNEQQQDNQQFKSEGVARQLFDVYDHRSVISKLIIDRTTSSPIQNLTNIAGAFTHFGSVFSSALSGLTPHAAAAENYNWGFNKYGIPSSLATDPKFEDPYANADAVANILDSAGCEKDTSCSWRSKAMACFGVDISKDSGEWAAVAVSDVNPGSDSYTGHDCTEDSDTWHRIMLFVYDSRLMDAIACDQNDDSSCANIDMSGTTTESVATAPGAGSLPTGTTQQLAQQILQNKNIKLVGRLVPEDIQAAAAGKASTAGKPLGQTLLSLIVRMGQSHTFNISSLESGGTGHSGPGDPHYAGDAVDITQLDGDPIASSGIGRTVHDIALITEIAPLMPKSTGSDFPHLSGFGQKQCGTTPSLPDGITTFEDECSHLHIQVPVGSP